jgi:hypothetical protein
MVARGNHSVIQVLIKWIELQRFAAAPAWRQPTPKGGGDIKTQDMPDADQVIADAGPSTRKELEDMSSSKQPNGLVCELAAKNGLCRRCELAG